MSTKQLGFDKGHVKQMIAEDTKRVGLKRQVKGLASALASIPFELTEEEQRAKVEAERRRKTGRVFQ